MKRHKKFLFVGFLAMLMFAFLSGQVISAESITIEGKINDDGQIVTGDDEVYEIGDNEKGYDLINLAGKKVKATGTVMEDDRAKVILVTSYEVIEE